MSCIAIITARGGSKRIPKKNIRNFCGKPIIAYTIESALQSNVFDEVMVSTDSDEISEIAQRYGAKVPFMRSDLNSNDASSTDDVLLEVLSEYEELGRSFSCMCCLYPTAPFVTSEKLKYAFDVFCVNKATAVMPVVSYSYPPQKALLQEKKELKYIFPEKYECRSQDLERWYHDAGQFYFYNVKEFVRLKGRVLNRIFPVFVSEMEAQDIDNETDWKLAELKYRMLHNLF